MHRQHPFDEATTGHGVRSIANLPHDDAVTNCLFRTIVRRFDSLDVDEGPKCVATLEQHSARLASFRVGARRAFREQCFEALLDGPHVNAERRARQRAIANPVPPGEHPLDLVEHSRADSCRFAVTLYDGLDISLEVSPAELSTAIRPPVVGSMSVGHEDAAPRAKQLLGGLGVAPRVDHEDDHVRGDALSTARLGTCSLPRASRSRRRA